MKNMLIKYYIIILIATGTTFALDCLSDEFTCKDGKRCVDNTKVCNEYPNCLDGSDETEELCKDWDYEYNYDDIDDGGFASWFGSFGEDEADDIDEDVDDVTEKTLDESSEDTLTDEDDASLEKCAVTECSARGVLSFLSDHTYGYTYDVIFETNVIGDKKKSSSLKISADVEVHVFSACEMKMTLKNVRTNISTSESDGTPNTPIDYSEISQLTEFPIRFSMKNGKIDIVCSFEKENGKILNFKKGILSLLQNSMPYLHLTHQVIEKDIVGNCPVTYKFLDGKGPSTLITKTRDEAMCSGKSYFHSSAKSIPYVFKGGVERLPLMEEKSYCQQEIRKGVIEESTCTHDHILSPFSSAHTNINSHVSQTLTKVSDKVQYFMEDEIVGDQLSQLTNAGGIGGIVLYETEEIQKRTDIMFDHLDNIHSETFFEDDSSYVEETTKLLDNIKIGNNDNVYHYSGKATIYAQLILYLRKYTMEQLTSLMRHREWGKLDKSLFLDAIPMVGTEPCVAFMVREIQKDFQPHLHGSWIRSISQIQSPDVPSIQAASKLLRKDEMPSNAFVHVGAAIHSYCSEDKNCRDKNGIQQVMQTFQYAINNGCLRQTKEQKHRVLMALKGIGNAGLAVNGDIISELEKCFKENRNKMEIRVAAASAFRRISCTHSRHQLHKMLLDSSQDSELRITAYLETMRCPNYDTIKLIHHLLINEEVNQVGSFIWSHLENIKESAMPSKSTLQALLSNQEFQNKFRNDVTKFSRNIELSAFYDDYNIGGSVESNIIFSDQSYLPRSASLNLTADLFGQSFNFFEIGGRVEGLERYFENVWKSDTSDLDQTDSISSQIIQSLISKSTRAAKYTAKETELSLYMKIFGNDIRYEHFHGISEVLEALNRVNPLNLLNQIKEGKEINIQRSTMPIGATYLVATSAGVPLGVGLDGVVSLDVTAEAKADLKSLFLTRNGEIKGKIIPKIDVDLRASLITDVFKSHTGCEVVGQLHSSVAMDGLLSINGSEQVRFDLNLPQETVEMVDLSAKLILIHDKNQDKPNRELIKDENIVGTSSSNCSPLEKELGIKFCWTLDIPDVSNGLLDQRALIQGPSRFMVAITKSDGLQAYTFKYIWKNHPDQLKFLLLFDTPGTTTSKEHNIDFRLNYNRKDAHFIVKTPTKKLTVKGKYIWTDIEKRLDATMNLDNTRGSFIIGYRLSNKAKHATLMPSFTLFWANQEKFKVTGNLESRLREQFQNLEKESLYYSVNLQYTAHFSGKNTGKITGHVNIDHNKWDVILDIPYYPQENGPEESIKVEYTKIYKIGDVEKIDRNWKIVFTQFPYLNFKGHLASKHYYGVIENDLQIAFGRHYKDPKHQVNIYQNLIFYGERDKTTFNGTVAIKYPKHDLDLRIGADLFKDTTDLNMGIVFQYATDASTRTRFHLIRTPSPFNIECNYVLFVPNWTDVKFALKIQEIETKNYEFDISASISGEKRLDLGGSYADQSNGLNDIHNLKLKIKLPQREIIYLNTTLLRNPREMAALIQLIWSSGHPYKFRIAYITEQDDLKLTQKKLEIDFRLPKQMYFWHMKYSIGEYITITNDIHIDRYRDLTLWLRLPKDRSQLQSAELKFYWDTNRDPHKKLSAKIDITNTLFELSSSITIFGQEYVSGWKSTKNVSYIENESIYDYTHRGHLTWKDDKKTVHDMTTGVTFYLKRASEVELKSYMYFTTPFDGWKNNSAVIEYSRDTHSIDGSLSSQWHHDEFLSMRFNSYRKSSGSTWNIGHIFDVRSSLDGLVTLQTEVSAERKPGNILAKTFVQWEEDKIGLTVEAEDTSSADDLQMSISSKGVSTLPGFQIFDIYCDFVTQERLADFYSKLTWENDVYQIKAKGLIFTGNEHLRTELMVTTPDHGDDTAFLFLRLYEDVLSMSDKIEARSSWFSQKSSMMGELTSQPSNFQLKLDFNTPLKDLPYCSLVVKHQSLEHQVTQAKIEWNDSNQLGFETVSHFDSLTDFLIKLTLLTPIPEYKELSAELSNLFSIESKVNVNSRVLAQVNDKKFGVGGRLQQGESPRLRVSLELYIPSPDLEELYFDIADKSTPDTRDFLISIGHGKFQDFNLNLKLKRTGTSMETFLVASAHVSPVAEEYQTMSLDTGVKIYWMTSRDIDIKLTASTVTKSYELDTKASLFPTGGGKIHGRFDFPYDSVRDIAFQSSYMLVPYPNDGYIDAQVFQHSRKIFLVSLKGNVRGMSGEIFLPTDGVNDVQFEYTLTAVDIAKSICKASGSINDHKFTLTSDVFLNNENYIIKMDGSLYTKYADLDQSKITGKGYGDNNNFVNEFVLRNDKIKYSMHSIVDFKETQDWDIQFKIFDDKKVNNEIANGRLRMQDVQLKPFILEFDVTTLKDVYKIELHVQPNHLPYETSLTWKFPSGAGTFEVNLNNLNQEKISSITYLRTEIPDNPRKEFTLSFDLLDKSPNKQVDVDIKLNFITKIDDQKSDIVLDGKLKQVTSEPGQILLSLTWPGMEPVVLEATASYKESFKAGVTTQFKLQLPDCKYGFSGNLDREEDNLDITSQLWWKRPTSDKQQLDFKGNFLLTKLHVAGNVEVRGPVFQTIQKGNVFYLKATNHTTLKLDTIIFNKISALEAHFNENQGQAHFMSDILWKGNPVEMSFNQAIDMYGRTGVYTIQWPDFNDKEEKYVKQKVQAKLNNTIIESQYKPGLKGIMTVTLPVTKNIPIILRYLLEYPSVDAINVTFGAEYQGQSIELEGQDIIVKTNLYHGRTTGINIKNHFWPVGGYFMRKNFRTGDIIEDKVAVFELSQIPTKSEVVIHKLSGSDGKRLGILGNIQLRKFEMSGGYTINSRQFASDFIAKWGPEQSIAALIDIKDKSAKNEKKNFLVEGYLANHIQKSTLNGQYYRDQGILEGDFMFNWNILDTRKSATTFQFNLQNKDESETEIARQWLINLYNPVLEKPVIVNGKLERNREYPLLMNMTLSYSKQKNSDLNFDIRLRKSQTENDYSSSFHISHPSSSLLAETSNGLEWKYPKYSFYQDYKYIDENNITSSGETKGEIDMVNKSVLCVFDATHRQLAMNFKILEHKEDFWLTVQKSVEEDSLQKKFSLYSSQPLFIMTFDEHKPQDLHQLQLYKQVVMEGGVQDNREAYLLVRHQEPPNNEKWYKDVNMFFRLNHSRLLSSEATWNPKSLQYIEDELGGWMLNNKEEEGGIISLIWRIASIVSEESSLRSKPILEELVQVMSPLVEDFKNGSFKFFDSFVQTINSTEFTEMEQDLISSVEHIYSNIVEYVNNVEFIKNFKTGRGNTIQRYLIQFFTKLHSSLQYFMENELSDIDIKMALKDLFKWFATSYDQAAKEAYHNLRFIVGDFQMKLSDWLQEKWHNVYHSYKPHIMKTVHLIEIETHKFLKRLSKTTQSLEKSFKSASYMKYLQTVYMNIYQKYVQWSSRSLEENLNLAYDYMIETVQDVANVFMTKVFPFTEDWMDNIKRAWHKLNKYETIRHVSSFTTKLYKKVIWVIDQIDIREMVIGTTAFVIENGQTIIKQTATEAQLRHLKAKTSLIWHPEEGRIYFNQKLPFRWLFFNETPHWREMFELPAYTKIKNWFNSPTQNSYLDLWYKHISLYLDPSSWLPPYEGTGYVIGKGHVITFDGRVINYDGTCNHVLAVDLVTHLWAVTIVNEKLEQTLHMHVEGKNIAITSNYKINIDGSLATLPIQMNETVIWRTDGVIHFTHQSGLSISWNLIHHVLSLTVPGRLFLNTAGLMGNYNYEPYDDMILPNGTITPNVQGFIDEWSLGPTKCRQSTAVKLNRESEHICERLFSSDLSQFKYCFYHVDPSPFLNICYDEYKRQHEDVCSVSFAYRAKCAENNIPIKLPTFCVKCEYFNAVTKSVMRFMEGESITLEKEAILKTHDVVILVDLGSCNRKVFQPNSFNRFMKSFDQTLMDEGSHSNRYTIVTYGSRSIYSTPTIVSDTSSRFTSQKNVGNILRNLKFGDSDFYEYEDKAFIAITYVSNLNFRPSSSITVLMFPCTPCAPSNRLDYSTVYHILKHSEIYLIIFKHGYFNTGKKSLRNKIIGYDSENAYTLKDAKRRQMGTSSIVDQIKPPKAQLEFCYPLALETGGAIYTAEVFKNSRKSSKLATVVGRKLDQMVKEPSDERCLCLSTQEVSPLVRCDNWNYGDFTVLEKYGLELDGGWDVDDYHSKDTIEADFYVP